MNRLHDSSPLLVLAARLQTAAAKTGLLAVTSALPGDGKSVTASDLAHVFARAGHRTLLVDANEFHPELAPMHKLRRPAMLRHADPPPIDGESDRLFGVTLWSTDDVVNASPADVADLCELFASRFRFTLFDCAPLPSSRIAQLLADAAESVVLTVREGRARRRDDALVADLLDARRLPVAGIVTTTHAARQRFAQRDRNPAPRERMRIPSLAGVPS